MPDGREPDSTSAVFQPCRKSLTDRAFAGFIRQFHASKVFCRDGHYLYRALYHEHGFPTPESTTAAAASNPRVRRRLMVISNSANFSSQSSFSLAMLSGEIPLVFCCRTALKLSSKLATARGVIPDG